MAVQFTRIAVKIGSNVLARKDGTLDVTRMSALVDQVAELRKAGVEVILISSGAVASGRSEIKPSKKLDSVEQRQLFSAVGQAKLINRYYELFREHGIPVGQVLTTKEMFVTEVNDRVQAVSDLIEIPVPPVASIEEARGKDILQIMGYFTAEEEKETDIFGKVLTHCEPMRWYPLFADIIARGNSKSTGIDKVLAYFDIDLKDTMAFGDGGNDIPMLKHVATGIAMGNAEPHVKAVADYVTTSVDEDGIANALKHFGLI